MFEDVVLPTIRKLGKKNQETQARQRQRRSRLFALIVTNFIVCIILMRGHYPTK